jgi:hypothetical protein
VSEPTENRSIESMCNVALVDYRETILHETKQLHLAVTRGGCDVIVGSEAFAKVRPALDQNVADNIEPAN